MFWDKKEKEKGESVDWLYENDITITHYLMDGLLAFDSENKLFLINPAAEKFLEISEKDVMGRSILEFNQFPKTQPLVSFLGGGLEECFREELEFNENLILEITSVHMNLEGQRVSTLVVLHDITRQKLADKMKSEFVTLAAHQLRTPISGIKWCLKTLLDGDLGPINKEQKEILAQAFKTNNKVVNLINDLLNVAEIEEGRYLKKMSLFSIEDVVKSVAEEYEMEINKKNIKITLLKKEEVPKVMMDPERIKIAFKNIFDNAVRYSLGGGEIVVSIALRGKEIEVKVKDSGIGIPISQQEKLFNKFFRSSNAMRTNTEGTGLGLYIAKNIIEAHEGRIWFESEENKGTAFYFTIPIRKEYAQFLTEDFY